MVNSKSQVCIVFCHEDFSEELHCVARWVRVEKEGPEDEIFDKEAAPTEREPAENQEGRPEEEEILPEDVFHAGAEDVTRMRHLGLNVDNDNNAAPENLPTNARTEEVEDVLKAQSWGWNQICNRAKLGIQNVGAHIKGRTSDFLSGLSRLDMFFMFCLPLIALVQDVTN